MIANNKLAISLNTSYTNTVKSSILYFDLRILLWAVLIIPFLEPWNVETLISLGFYPDLLSFASVVVGSAKAGISIIAIIWFLLSKKNHQPNHLLFFCCFSLSMAFMSILSSGTFLTNELFRAVQYIGFACLIFCLYERNPSYLLYSLLLVFSFLGILAFISIYLTDGGFIPGLKESARQYSFGGKNSIFVTLCPLVILIAIYCGAKKKKNTFAIPILALIFACTSWYIDSSSSFVFFILLGIMLIPFRGRFIFSFIPGKFLLFAVVLIFFGTVLGSFVTDALSGLFSLVGRDSSFSNRDQIWIQALNYISANPIIGSGSQITYGIQYEIGSASTNIAHCYYLDIAAKYGLITLSFFLLDVVAIIRNYDRNKTELSFLALSGFMLVLGHSLFDDLVIYVYVILRFLLIKSSYYQSIRDKYE